MIQNLLFIIVMFKKKQKKQHRVLNLEDEEQNGENRVDNLSVHPNEQKQQPNSAIQHQDAPTKNLQGEIRHGQIAENDLQKGSGHQKLLTGDNHERNSQNLYTQDLKEQLNNQPRKMIKQSFPGHKQKPISNSTAINKQKLNQAVHEAFDDINYKAGKNLIKDLHLEADMLEEQLAKKRFMQNVEATKLQKEGKINTKIYKGMNAYANHKLTNDEIQHAEEAYKKRMGPSRVNSTIKNSCRFDYVLNLCKDWHDSGYCPFGNSCLYLHDRSNLKTGWELEKDFEQAERERWKRINNPDLAKKQDREKLLKTIEKYKPPEKCSVCSKPFAQPVEIECGHIFCTNCAIKIVKCKECGKRLSGIMNSAKQKLVKQTADYSEMLQRLQNQQQQTQTKRRKFQNVDSIDVFAD